MRLFHPHPSPLTVAVGSTNEAKVLAVKEVLQDTVRFSHAEVVGLTVSSGVSDQPITLKETIKGAKNRAKNAFDLSGSQLSVGIESGLMETEGASSGYLHVSACCIYDGTRYYTGLSTGFEIPPRVLTLVLDQKKDLVQAILQAGMSTNEKLGSTEGLIGILTKGKVDRKEYSKQCVLAAIVQLENSEWYQNPIKAIIFDCDGTLVDSEEFHFLAWSAAFKKRGYTLNKEVYINHFSGRCDFELSHKADEMLGFTCSDELLRDKNKFFADYQVAGIAPVTPTIEFVKRLFREKEKYGLKLAVASGARKEEILSNLKNLNIEHYFDVIISGRDDLSEYSDSEGTNKPKPYVYLKAAKLLGLKTEECVAVEDSKTGVSSAIGAGCVTIAVPNPFTQQHDLSQAHMKIESFAGLTIADFLKMVSL